MIAQIRERYTEEEFRAVVDRYVDALRGIIDLADARSYAELEKRMEMIMEEILADAHAGMNSFGAGATQFTDTVNRFLADNYISRGQSQDNGVRQTNGPPARAEKNTAESGGESYSFHGYADDGKGIYESNFPKGTPKKAKGERILRYIQDVWSKKPITLRIETDTGTRYIEAQFDPTFDEGENVRTDASKLMGGNRHGTSAEQRVTLDLADDYYQLASEARYNGSKEETGKETLPHQGVKMWHYFVNDIYFAEYGSNELMPYTVSINVKEKADGNFFYSFSAEKNGESSTQRTLHAVVNSNNEAAANRNLSTNSIATPKSKVKDNSGGGNMSETEPRERFSYAGEHALTANSQTLGEAREMERMGADAETIRQETGWFRGRDGKWRFEVDDSTAQVAEEISNYMTLGELLPGAEILRAYPEMKDISVVFQSLDPGVNAQYNRQFDHIDVSYKLKGDPDGIRSAVLHEIQHAIQNREGFTKGSTVGSWEKRIKEGFDARKGSDIREAAEAERKLQQFREEDPQLYRDMMELDAMAPDLPRGAMNWDTLEQIEEDPPQWQAYDARRDELEEIYGERMWEFNSALYDLQRINKRPARTAEELYWDTAGEIEARNVAGRRNLTAEERKNTPPILGGEDTVFAETTSRNDLAIGKTTDNKPFVTIDVDILAGVPRQDWVKTVTDNLKKSFPSGVTVGRNLIAVDKQSRQEMTFSKYTRWLMNNDPSLYEDKLRATNNIDEIIQASTDWVNEGLNHSRKDTITDFARGKVLLDVGGRKYSAEVVVGTRKNGTMIMYDLLKITPVQFTEKETDMVITANPSPEADRNTMSVSGDSLAQSGYSVKRNTGERYSIDDGAELSGDKGTDRQEQEYQVKALTQRELEQERQEWLQREYDEKNRKKENRPTIARQELKKTMLSLFSVPEGVKAETGLGGKLSA